MALPKGHLKFAVEGYFTVGDMASMLQAVTVVKQALEGIEKHGGYTLSSFDYAAEQPRVAKAVAPKQKAAAPGKRRGRPPGSKNKATPAPVPIPVLKGPEATPQPEPISQAMRSLWDEAKTSLPDQFVTS